MTVDWVRFDDEFELRHALVESIAASRYLYCHPGDRGKIGRAIVADLAAAGYGIHRMTADEVRDRAQLDLRVRVRPAGVAASRRSGTSVADDDPVDPAG